MRLKKKKITAWLATFSSARYAIEKPEEWDSWSFEDKVDYFAEFMYFDGDSSGIELDDRWSEYMDEDSFVEED